MNLLLLFLIGCTAATATAADAIDATADPTAATADASNRLGIEVFQRLAKVPGDAVLSPASLHAVLAMTSAGARGDTLAAMQRVCHFPAQDTLHAGWHGLQDDLANIPPGAEGKPAYPLSMANLIAVQQGLTVAQIFGARCRDGYHAAVMALDFSRPGQAAATIDGWVDERTAGLIPRLLVATDCAGASLVLVNTLYLEPTWGVPFSIGATRDEVFHHPGQADSTVPTMRGEREIRYADCGTAQVVSLPYVGGRLAMTIVVPKAVDGLSTILAGSTDALAAMLAAPTLEARVNLYLPRFHCDAHSELHDPLCDLGMGLAFNPVKADFTGMLDRPDGRAQALFISHVIQDCRLQVDETGTTAAAATAVIMKVCALAPQPPMLTATVRADRPFLVALHEVRTGLILMLARVENPSVH